MVNAIGILMQFEIESSIGVPDACVTSFKSEVLAVTVHKLSSFFSAHFAAYSLNFDLNAIKYVSGRNSSSILNDF
jgi:hypothetical protein